MREKYIEERYPRMMTGLYTDPRIVTIDGTIDIVAATGSEAKRMAEEYNKLYDVFVALARAWDKEDPTGFSNYWYGDEVVNRLTMAMAQRLSQSVGDQLGLLDARVN